MKVSIDWRKVTTWTVSMTVGDNSKENLTALCISSFSYSEPE